MIALSLILFLLHKLLFPWPSQGFVIDPGVVGRGAPAAFRYSAPVARTVSGFGSGSMSMGGPVSASMSKPKLICYYTNWAQYRPAKGKFLPEDVDPGLCTHIHYAFAKIEDGVLQPYEWNDAEVPGEWAVDKGMYERVLALRKRNPGMKVLLAVGGWNHGGKPFTRLVSSGAAMRRFAERAASFLRQFGFDGLDIDWEYPGSVERGGADSDKERFPILLRILRRRFEEESRESGRPRLLLAAAVGAGSDTINNGYNIKQLAPLLDYVALMAYDLHGSWEDVTGFNSPLTGYDDDSDTLTVRWAVDRWLSGGVPREKLILGLATYGRTFTLKDRRRHTVGAPASGPGDEGSFTRSEGFLSYYEICSRIKNDKGWSFINSEKQGSCYIHRGDQWIAYDDRRQLMRKVAYLNEMALGGAMVWALDLDDFNGVFCGEGRYPLVRAVREALDEGLTSKHIPPAEDGDLRPELEGGWGVGEGEVGGGRGGGGGGWKNDDGLKPDDGRWSLGGGGGGGGGDSGWVFPDNDNGWSPSWNPVPSEVPLGPSPPVVPWVPSPSVIPWGSETTEGGYLLTSKSPPQWGGGGGGGGWIPAVTTQPPSPYTYGVWNNNDNNNNNVPVWIPMTTPPSREWSVWTPPTPPPTLPPTPPPTLPPTPPPTFGVWTVNDWPSPSSSPSPSRPSFAFGTESGVGDGGGGGFGITTESRKTTPGAVWTVRNFGGWTTTPPPPTTRTYGVWTMDPSPGSGGGGDAVGRPFTPFPIGAPTVVFKPGEYDDSAFTKNPGVFYPNNNNNGAGDWPTPTFPPASVETPNYDYVVVYDGDPFADDNAAEVTTESEVVYNYIYDYTSPSYDNNNKDDDERHFFRYADDKGEWVRVFPANPLPNRMMAALRSTTTPPQPPPTPRRNSKDGIERYTKDSGNAVADDGKGRPLCRNRFQTALLPVPGDCGAFYQCVHAGTPAARARRVSCPRGLHFSPWSRVCDWPRNAGCRADDPLT